MHKFIKIKKSVYVCIKNSLEKAKVITIFPTELIKKKTEFERRAEQCKTINVEYEKYIKKEIKECEDHCE